VKIKTENTKMKGRKTTTKSKSRKYFILAIHRHSGISGCIDEGSSYFKITKKGNRWTF
jgi:hypothetical protein